MRIIALDIDGVLNNYVHYIYRKKSEHKIGSLDFMKANIDPWNTRNLSYIAKNVKDLRIVISSTWRMYYEIEDFNKYFSKFDMKDLVIGKTLIRLSSDFDTRSREIDIWMKENSIKKEDYVVLDDHSIYHPTHPDFDRFYQTDCNNGLTYTDACNVIEKFDTEWKKPRFFF